jgi:hypothetical protein
MRLSADQLAPLRAAHSLEQIIAERLRLESVNNGGVRAGPFRVGGRQ